MKSSLSPLKAPESPVKGIYQRWLLTYQECVEVLGFEPPNQKYIFYGESGTGKSTLAATFPGPNLVLSWDPEAKTLPYIKGLDLQYGETQYDDNNRCPPVRHIDCYLPQTGEYWGRVELYEELEPENPLSYQAFLKRAVYLRADWLRHTFGELPRHIIWDSHTMAEKASLRYQEALNPQFKDPRKWYGEMKNNMVTEVLVRLAYGPSGAIVICHTETTKDEFTGSIERGISAVGKFGSEMPAGYSEIYRAYCRPSPQGSEYKLQTAHDGTYPARTTIGAPNPCEPHYLKLWENYQNINVLKRGKGGEV